MKKITLAALLATSVMTMSSANAQSVFDGFYAGAIMNAYVSSISDYNDGYLIKTYSSDTQYAPAMFFGYGMTLSKSYYIGLEANWSSDGAKSTSTWSDSTGPLVKWSSKAKTTKLIGIKGGYLLSDDIILSIKYKRGNADHESSIINCFASSCSADSVNTDIQSVGLGLDYQINKTLFATAEIAKTTPTSSTLGQEVATYNIGAGLGYRF